MYGADLFVTGQLIGGVLRSPHAHAKIEGIDVSSAMRLPGVEAVITSKDLPDLTGGDSGLYDILENCMARDRALYDGHAIAAVAAVDKATVKEALELIDVEYTILPHVTDVDDAMKPGAPIVQPKLRTENSDSDEPTNIVRVSKFGHGNLDAGFDEAHVVVEKSFKTEQAHQGYIEPHACLASVNPDGRAELWVTTQGPHDYRNCCAALLGIDCAKLKLTASEIGGGFGGKTHVWTEPLALALSRKAMKPVKLVMSREEVFRSTGPTSTTSIDIKIGARRDGTITAASAVLRYLDGAFPGPWGTYGGMAVWACYDLQNVESVAYDVIANRPKVAAYRAPSAPMAAFAVESAIDVLAAELAIDPVDLRLLNAADEGTQSSWGPVYPAIGLRKTLEAAKSSPHYRSPLPPGQGRGMACAFWFNLGGPTSSGLTIALDGTVNVTVGTIDVGGARASLSMVAAEELGVSYEKVQCNVADTSSLGHNETTHGSRGTFSSSMAIIFCARRAIQELKKRAALTWDISEDEVEWEDGYAIATGTQNNNLKPLSLEELAKDSLNTGGPISGHSEITADGAGVSFSTHICDVEVDKETGAVRVKRYTVFQDAGKAIHPDYVEGQLQGGAAQGIGWALNEEYVYGEDGRLQNPGFLDYRMPVCSDLPFIDTQILEIPNPTHPYGVRGVGETSIVPPLAAVGNAVSHAIGKRMTHIPMSPPRVLKVIEETLETSQVDDG